MSPRPDNGPLASKFILVNKPGVTTSDLSYFEYEQRRVPLFPFERGATHE